MALEFTDANFAETALEDGVSVVDFWAPWCGPCKMLSPIIDELAGDYEGKAKIGKVNIDSNAETSRKYRVMSIPTVIILKNGEIFEKITGLTTKANLTAKIDAALAN